MPAQIAIRDALHALFHPRAVAVIGASGDATKHSCIVLTNLRDTGFPGRIYDISRRPKEARAASWLDGAGSMPRP
jgi:acyl-CoA synthetase (NDP forming)